MAQKRAVAILTIKLDDNRSESSVTRSQLQLSYLLDDCACPDVCLQFTSLIGGMFQGGIIVFFPQKYGVFLYLKVHSCDWFDSYRLTISVGALIHI